VPRDATYFGDAVEGPPNLVDLAGPVAAENVVRRATQQQRVGCPHVRIDLFARLGIPERALPAGVLEVAVLLRGATIGLDHPIEREVHVDVQFTHRAISS
jgi:hypothetical protein